MPHDDAALDRSLQGRRERADGVALTEAVTLSRLSASRDGSAVRLDERIASFVIDVADALGLDAIAEGVETTAQGELDARHESAITDRVRRQLEGA